MKKIFSLFTLATIISNTILATPTKLVVRVKAKDAKFIGTGIGGAQVTIKNNLTGAIIASGVTTGASGNTELIMKTPRQRNASQTDANTAKFETSIDIEEPILVDIETTAPLSRKNAAIKGAIQAWLIPGKHIDGEGLIIELPGFIVDVLSPTSHQPLKYDATKAHTIAIKSSITMLCGCTVTKGGTWDADQIDAFADIYKDGKKIKTVALSHNGTPNLFDASFEVKDKGSYLVIVQAYDKITKNTGIDKTTFAIQ